MVDALAHLGVTHIDMPLTPERVWRAIQAAKASAFGGGSLRPAIRRRLPLAADLGADGRRVASSCCIAKVAASSLECISSFWRMFCTWVRTVCGLM